MDQQSLTYFVAGCAYLYLKMFANSGVQGFVRWRGKDPKYKEDAMFFGRGAAESSKKPDILVRADACWRNDLENIPMFIVSALCGLLSGLAPAVFGSLIFAFCAGRTLHTVTLLTGKQPWRFFGYLIGVVSTGVMFVLSLRQLGW